MWDCELGNEACDSDREADEDEGRARLIFVGEPGEDDNHRTCEKVDGNSK